MLFCINAIQKRGSGKSFPEPFLLMYLHTDAEAEHIQVALAEKVSLEKT